MFARKVHYSSEGEKKVLLRLSPDCQELSWITMPKKGFFAKGKISSIRLSEVRGMFVGPFSSTLVRYKPRILIALKNLQADPPAIESKMKEEGFFFAW